MTGPQIILKLWAGLLICTVLTSSAGCRFPWPTGSNTGEAPPSPSMVAQYRQAVTAYESKAYPVALKRFKAIHEKARNKDMARNALFGMACSQLMAAETPEQYQDAITLWESWVQVAPSSVEKENPLLLVPIVKEKMIFSNIPLTSEGNGDTEAGPKVSQWLVINAANEIERLRGKLESADQTNLKLKKSVASLEKQMAKLQEKIKALETIDQKMQQKKSAIPSTDATNPR